MLGRSFEATSLSDHGLQNRVFSFSSELVDNLKESQGNLDNMFSLRSCGKRAFSTSNVVSSGLRGAAVVGVISTLPEFWT